MATTTEFLKTAIDRWRFSDDAESHLRQDMLSDIRFRATRDFWPADIEAERIRDGRPVLKINELPQYIKQITNQQRANRIAIQVNPHDSDSDPKTATAIQGLVRNVEVNSNADVAYATAFEHQVTMGRGYVRLTTEYLPGTFDQDIRIKRVPDPLSLYNDPTIAELDGSDSRFCHYIEDIPKDRFKEMFGEDAIASYTAFMKTGQRLPMWAAAGCYRVSHYYYLETSTATLVEIEYLDFRNIETGPALVRATVDKSALPDDMPPEWRIVQEREDEIVQCYYALITPCEVLSGNDERTGGRPFPSRYIPVVPFVGDEIRADGEVDYRGIVRDSKSPTKMKSYWLSSMTEVIGATPRAPYIGYEGQFKGHEVKWRNANRKNFPYLEVVPMTIGGHPAPIPQRQQFEPAIQAMAAVFQISDNVTKGTIGMYEPSLGMQGSEQTGRAILARQRKGDQGTSNFGENANISIRQVGRIVVDMIPRVYAPGRVLRVLGVNDRSEAIMVNTDLSRGEAQRIADGVAGIYDIWSGRYDVSTSAGPSLPSRRAEAVEAMLQLVQSEPSLLKVMGDLLVKNMDWPGAAEIAERIRRTIPAHILGDEDGAEMEGMPPEVRNMLTQLKQQLAEAQQANAVKYEDIKSRERIAERKIQSDQKIAEIEAKVDVMIAQMKADSEAAKRNMEAFLKRLEIHMSQQHDIRLAAIDHEERSTDRLIEQRTSDLDREATRETARDKASATKSRSSKPSASGKPVRKSDKES